MSLLNLIKAILIASVPFQILRFLAGVTEKYLKPWEGIHPEMVENSFRARWSPRTIVITELFEVVLPALFFTLILPFLPLSGIKVGIFFGIFIFFVATLPHMVIISQTIKLSTNFIVVYLFWQFLKNIIVFGTIGAIYRF
jgi:hypothetical protein